MTEDEFKHESEMDFNIKENQRSIKMQDNEELYSWPAAWVMMQPGPSDEFEFTTNATVTATVEENGPGLRIMNATGTGVASYPHFQMFVSLNKTDIDQLISHLESIKEDVED